MQSKYDILQEDEQATLFFTETRESFQFLEHQYGYQRLEEFVRGVSDGRDATVVNRYVGSHIGIEISWYFVGSNIVKQKRLDPNLFIPGLKQQDEPSQE